MNPKVFREGRKGKCPHRLFYSWLWQAQEIEGGFSHSRLWPAHENGLMLNVVVVFTKLMLFAQSFVLRKTKIGKLFSI